jgi:hypothetical protein
MKIAEISVPGFDPRPWLTGRCFDFALALHQRMPDAEFVIVRSIVGKTLSRTHVALRRGNVYYDARGAHSDEHTFKSYHDDWGSPSEEIIEPISLQEVERHASKIRRDIEMAYRAVDAVYDKK